MALFTTWGGSTIITPILRGDGNVFTFTANHPGIAVAYSGAATNIDYAVYQFI